MRALVKLLWDVIALLRWGSLPFMLGGVGLFGHNLMRMASRHPDNVSSPSVWRGRAAKSATKVFGVGVGLLALSILLASLAPNPP